MTPTFSRTLGPALGLLLLIGELRGADPVMEAYSRAWALNGQTTTRGQAIERLKAIMETNPQFWRAYKTLAHAYVVANQVRRGEGYFRNLVTQDQANGYPHFALGILLNEGGRYWEAVDELRMCARMDARAFACYTTLPEAMALLLKRPASPE